MPIEIKELIIRASVRDESGQAGKNNNSSTTGAGKLQEEQIVNRCVEQIMNILRIKNER